MENMTGRYAGQPGIPTGFPALDDMTGGLQPSDLIVLGARPAMGKTAFAIQMLRYAAETLKKPAVIFSLEMTKKQLKTRMLSAASGVETQKILTRRLDGMELEQLNQAKDAFDALPLIIDDTPGISLEKLREKCIDYREKQDIQLIVIDYLQLMQEDAKPRQQEMDEISRGLKALARELKLPVVVLSQVSCECEEREHPRPELEDLRGYGCLVQQADVVLFLYREEYYHKEPQYEGMAEVIVAKNMGKETGTVRMEWNKERMRFGEREEVGT